VSDGFAIEPPYVADGLPSTIEGCTCSSVNASRLPRLTSRASIQASLPSRLPPRSIGDPYISTQTPAPQRCPGAHCELLEQVQKPASHVPVGPHWELVTHVPHVPSTHACPPPHWLFAVQAAQAPLMHARPFWGMDDPTGSPPPWLQSSNFAQAPQTPPTHACPVAQSAGDSQAPHSWKGCLQPCPGSQSAGEEHVH
jgi:hypothetical protein